MFAPAIFCCLMLCFAVAWLGSLALMVYGLQRRSVPLAGASGLVFGVLSLIAIAYGVLAFDAGRPPVVFKQFFGFEPTPDVADLQSEYFSMGDAGHAFLRFRASPATVERIVRQRGLEEVPDSFFPHSNLQPPEWWTPPTGAKTLRYGGEFTGREFYSEGEVLIYDQLTNTVYYHYIGID
jgi:hypothetical protein